MKRTKTSAIRFAAAALGAIAVGSFAIGALAAGAVAIGALAIGRLKVGRLTVCGSSRDRWRSAISLSGNYVGRSCRDQHSNAADHGASSRMSEVGIHRINRHCNQF